MNRPAITILFTVALAVSMTANAQSGCPLPAPSPLEPQNGAPFLNATVTFKWTAVSGATSYELWASTDGAGYEQLGSTDQTSGVAQLTRGSSIEWYVIASNAGCQSPPSAHFTFTTEECSGPASSLIAPSDGAMTPSPVHFFWSAVPGADGYRLWIAPYVDNGEFELRDETSSGEATIFLPPGQWAWLIETTFPDCDSSYTDYNVFEIPRAANCPASGPKLLTPENGASVKSPVTLSWTPVPGAINYEIWASLDGGELQFVDETNETSAVEYLGVGHVEWFVDAQFNGCDTQSSETRSFDVPYDPACDHDSAYPIAPLDGLNNVPLKVDFVWTPVDGASRYNVWASVDSGEAFKVGTTTGTRFTANIQVGDVLWAVEAEFDGCGSTLSPVSSFTTSGSAVCRLPQAPEVFIDPAANSGDQYYMLWSPGLNTLSYEVQESTDPNFAGATTRPSSDILLSYQHDVTRTTRYYYRVRSFSSCDLGWGPYSDAATIVVQPIEGQTGDQAGTIASFGTQQQVIQKVHIPGAPGTSTASIAAGQTFTATTDQPWLTVTPSSGTIPPGGIDLTLSADPRRLAAGTSTGTLRINTTTTSASSVTPTGNPPASVPVSISLVTPVAPDAGNAPLPNSLIIPAVGHAQGAGTLFESDVRITNASAQAVKCLLNFTPSGQDGTKVGQQANIQIEAGDTTALNDILKNFFGFAGENDNAVGVLEIRPISSVSAQNSPSQQSNALFASSRTFALTSNGTYGQYIPAIPFSTFIGKNASVSLQQISENASYHTNVGLVEAAGQNATVQLTVRDASGAVIAQMDKALKPGEHQQFALGVPVDNGRLEAKVTSSTGKVTAYASVLDNQTHDPMLIMPVNTATVSADRYVLPGMAQATTANANWRSDVRLLNAGTASVPATITFYEQGNPTPRSVTHDVKSGEMLVFDQALQSLFGLDYSAGGAIVVTTAGNSKLVASARTYNLTAAGTYGQFVPGVTVSDGVGLKDRALQVLQAESSDRFRTNLGIVELTGQPVTVQVTAYTPDSKISVSADWNLGPNEFIQINNILGRLNISNAYNARISMKVISGDGKISGYASLIDNRTQDPTYIPAQ